MSIKLALYSILFFIGLVQITCIDLIRGEESLIAKRIDFNNPTPFQARIRCFNDLREINDENIKLFFMNWLKLEFLRRTHTFFESTYDKLRSLLSITKDNFQSSFNQLTYENYVSYLRDTQEDRAKSINQLYYMNLIDKLLEIYETKGNDIPQQLKTFLSALAQPFINLNAITGVVGKLSDVLKKLTYIDLIVAKDRVFQDYLYWNKLKSAVGSSFSASTKVLVAALSTAATVGISFTPATALGGSAAGAAVAVVGGIMTGAFDYSLDKDAKVRDLRLSFLKEEMSGVIDALIATEVYNIKRKEDDENFKILEENKAGFALAKKDNKSFKPKHSKNTKLDYNSHINDPSTLLLQLTSVFYTYEPPNICKKIFHGKVIDYWTDVNQFISIYKQISYIWPDYGHIIEHTDEVSTSMLNDILSKLTQVQLSTDVM